MSEHAAEAAASRPAVDPAWYATAFDTLYPLVYAHRSVESARAEADFAMSQLKLEHCGKILDLCCGGGRHLLHLSSYCAELVGLDYSSDLLRIAGGHLPANVLLVRGDMRALPFQGTFDAVVNFFTSYGYFQTDAENARVLTDLSGALRPGGRFFMDYLNPDLVRATLVPRSERALEARRIVEERWMDSEGLRVNKRTRVYRDDALESESMESVRLYSLEEMRAALEGAGLAIEFVFGDYTGAAYTSNSPRMMFVGQRS